MVHKWCHWRILFSKTGFSPSLLSSALILLRLLSPFPSPQFANPLVSISFNGHLSLHLLFSSSVHSIVIHFALLVIPQQESLNSSVVRVFVYLFSFSSLHSSPTSSSSSSLSLHQGWGRTPLPHSGMPPSSLLLPLLPLFLISFPRGLCMFSSVPSSDSSLLSVLIPPFLIPFLSLISVRHLRSCISDVIRGRNRCTSTTQTGCSQSTPAKEVSPHPLVDKC